MTTRLRTPAFIFLMAGWLVLSLTPLRADASMEGIDIGNPSIAGSVSVDGGEVTIVGGGASLWSWGDSCHFACGPVTGDVDVIARLASYENIQTYTKSGIMVRETLDYNSKNALAGMRGGSNATFQRRTTTGGSTVETRAGDSLPAWLRLVRAGDDFSAYHSDDGVIWQQIGETQTIAMNATVYVGLVVSAGSDTEAVTAHFDGISGLDTSPPANEPPTADAGPDQQVADTTDAGEALVTLDAGGSSDPDGTIVEYLWSEGGVPIATGLTAQAILGVGTHTITLEAVDDDGDSATDTVEIIVTAYVNQAPVADAGADVVITDADESGDEWVSLDASASTDGDGTIVDYLWRENGNPIAVGMTAQVLLAAGTHTLTLEAVDDDGDSATDTVEIVVAPPALSLSAVDIGAPSVAGNVELTWDGAILTGGGSALWGSADSCLFACRAIQGDATITARLNGYDNIQAYTKAGLMIRQSLDANAPNAFVGMRESYPMTFQARTVVGGATGETRVNGGMPVWLRLARSGNQFDAFYSDDGVTWSRIGSTVAIDMPADAYVGLVLSAGNDTETVAAHFDGLSLTHSGNAAPVADAGADQTVTDTDGNGLETIALDASASSDYDGQIVAWIWSESGVPIASGATPVLDLPVGRHVITLTTTDDDGDSGSDDVVVTVNPFGSLTPQQISDHKSGISLEVLGDYGVDYLVEQWYHDPRIDPRCTIYIRSDVPIDLFHNDQNINRTGDGLTESVVIGADGLDGIPDSGDEGIIRYRVDQNMTTRAMWADSSTLYPAWPGRQSFDAMQYDPGVAVVGATGPLPGGDITDRSAFYWRGMIDAFGDEWHVMAVGDDDTTLQSYYANRSSDGKIYYFVVNPTTPACNIVARDETAQFYTTPPKTYFVPVIRSQVSYLLGDCDIELAALNEAEVQYSLAEEGQPENWQVYESSINTCRSGMVPDTRYALKYRIGSDGPVKTRIVHFDPAYPSDSEQHPKNILWTGQAGLQRIRDRIDMEPYATEYSRYLNNPWTHRRTSPYKSTLLTGQRWCGGPTLPSSFPLLMEGFDTHPECSQFLHDAMLDTWLNLDPVGLEGIWSLNSPTREICSQGYANAGTPLGLALSYDWVIKEMRAGSHPYGFTAIEDYKIRDNLAAFANWTAYVYSKPGSSDADGNFVGMWGGAWTHVAAVVAAVLDNYDSDLYGTSGAPSGTFNAPRPWTPFPDHPRTWWQTYNDKDAALYGYPNQEVRGTYWGLLNENYEWADRAPYWNLMAGYYYLTMNFRHHYDGYHYPHLDTAVRMIAEGGQVMPLKWDEGPLHHASVAMVNRNFPEIAEIMIANLDPPSSLNEQSIANSLWSRGVVGVCLYEDDWDAVESLPGDANGDDSVDIQDFVILKQNYGTTGGATVGQGDFNGDGNVDIQDFVILKQNYGSSR